MADEREQPSWKRAKRPAATWRIYPPPAASVGKSRSSFAIGSQVYFRPKSAKEDGKHGLVVEPVGQTDDKRHVWVNFNNDDKPKSISCKRLVPVFDDDDQSIMFTPETIPYRHLACSQVCGQDDILEIGCSTGEASTILYRYGRSWVGFDSSADMIQQCSARLEEAVEKKYNRDVNNLWHAAKIDALTDPSGALEVAHKFSKPKGPSVVFLDIGGNREEAGVIEMMSWVFKSFSDLRVLVIKSREIVRALQTTSSTTKSAIDSITGIIPNGSQWFQEKLTETLRQKTTRHPLQAPLVYSPMDPTQPICRYHNYDPKGCKKGAACPYNHEHCHICLEKGHRAIDCERP